MAKKQAPPAELRTVEDVVAAVRHAYAVFDTQDLWWRGQAVIDDKKWALVPKAFRLQRNKDSEHDAYLRFCLQAPTRFAACPAQDDYAGWLFLMQHHGLATRLLDWTESPLLAALFATSADFCSPEEAELPGRVWLLAPGPLNMCHGGRSSDILTPKNDSIRWLIEEPFDVDKPQKPDHNAPTVGALMPREIHVRMMMQLARFTIHSNSVPLDQLPEAHKFLWHYDIPAECKVSLADQIRALGIKKSLAFPDLDTLAKEIQDDTDKADRIDGAPFGSPW